MGLLDRLTFPLEGESRLPVHQFIAALAEYKRGVITGAQVATTFELSTQETTNLQAFLTKFDTGELTREKVHDVLLLGSGKSGDPPTPYYSRSKVQTELGL